MKNLPYILNAILFALVIGLYVMHFSGTKGEQTEKAEATTENMTAGAVSVAYVNMDTLFEYYDYYADVIEDFQGKRTQAQKNLEKRGRKLEQDMVSFQRRAQAGLMSQKDMRATEQTLVGQQEEFQKYSQTLSAGLMEEESLLNQKLYDKIQDYLKELNKDKKYSVIFNYTERSPTFWLAEDAFDITKTVVDSLNEQYEAEKGAETAE